MKKRERDRRETGRSSISDGEEEKTKTRTTFPRHSRAVLASLRVDWNPPTPPCDMISTLLICFRTRKDIPSSGSWCKSSSDFRVLFSFFLFTRQTLTVLLFSFFSIGKKTTPPQVAFAAQRRAAPSVGFISIVGRRLLWWESG